MHILLATPVVSAEHCCDTLQCTDSPGYSVTMTTMPVTGLSSSKRSDAPGFVLAHHLCHKRLEVVDCLLALLQKQAPLTMGQRQPDLVIPALLAS